jgi:putative transposase
MDTIRTITCKLAPTREQRAELDATFVAFADACNFIADVARQIHSSNKVKVQHACYAEVRSHFGLSANLAIRAIARVCAALKVKAKAHSTFAPTVVYYDQRIFSFREWDWTFSLTLLHRRERLATTLGDYQKGWLKGHTPTSATLDGVAHKTVGLKVVRNMRRRAVSIEPPGITGTPIRLNA